MLTFSFSLFFSPSGLCSLSNRPTSANSCPHVRQTMKPHSPANQFKAHTNISNSNIRPHDAKSISRKQIKKSLPASLKGKIWWQFLSKTRLEHSNILVILAVICSKLFQNGKKQKDKNFEKDKEVCKQYHFHL